MKRPIKYLLYYGILFTVGIPMLTIIGAMIILILGLNGTASPDSSLIFLENNESLISYLLLFLVFFPIARLGYKTYKTRNKKEKNTKSLAVIKPFTLQFRTSLNKNLLTVTNPFRGIYIQGGNGSGKSGSFFKPMLEQFSKMNMSGILYDYKSPELISLAYGYYKDNPNINFSVLDFKDLKRSNRINPLSINVLTKSAYAFDIAQSFIYNLLPENIKQQDYWGRSAVSLTAGTIWYLKKHHPEYCTIPHLITFILKCPAERMVQIISSDNETAGMIASLKEALDQNAGKQIAGVLGTLKNAVAPLNIPDIFYLFSGDEVNLDLNNPEKPTFLGIGNDEGVSDTYQALISIVVTIAGKMMNKPNKWQSAIILDEAPTLYIPGFERIPATGRSNKIITVYGAQDFSQVIDKYGKEKADALISNLNNQFYGRTINKDSAKSISEMFDKEDKYFQSHSSGNSTSTKIFGGGSTNANVSTSIQERYTVPVRKIRNANPGQFFALVAEGNYKEWIGVQLELTDENPVLPPIVNANIDTVKVFNRIHKEVETIIQNGGMTTNDFEIEKEKSIDIGIKEIDNNSINKFFDEQE